MLKFPGRDAAFSSCSALPALSFCDGRVSSHWKSYLVSALVQKRWRGQSRPIYIEWNWSEWEKVLRERSDQDWNSVSLRLPANLTFMFDGLIWSILTVELPISLSLASTLLLWCFNIDLLWSRRPLPSALSSVLQHSNHCIPATTTEDQGSPHNNSILRRLGLDILSMNFN